MFLGEDWGSPYISQEIRMAHSPFRIIRSDDAAFGFTTGRWGSERGIVRVNILVSAEPYLILQDMHERGWA